MTLPVQASWAAWQSDEEETQQANIVFARNYYNGEQDVQLTDRQKEFIGYNQADQRFALNYCPVVVDSVADRLIVDGFTTGDKALAEWIDDTLAALRFDELQLDVHSGGVLDGEYFVFVNWDEDQGLQFIQHPRYTDPIVEGTGFGCKAHYKDDDPNQRLLFVSKRWTERGEVNGKTVAVRRMNLYYPDRVEKYEMGAGGGKELWNQIEVVPWVDSRNQPLGVPIIHFRNPGDRSELWDATGPQDIINKTALDIIAIADTAGFPIYLCKGFSPTTDGKEPASDGGNYLKIHPGMMIGPINSEGAMDKLEASDIRPLMDALDSWIIKLAQITGTPHDRFQVTRQVASNETLKQQEEPLLVKIRKRQVKFGNAWENAIYMARRLANEFGGESLNEEALIETRWRPAETRDEQAEEMTFWATCKTAGEAGVPLPAYLELQGWNPDRIAIVTGNEEYQERQAARQAMTAAFGQEDEG